MTKIKLKYIYIITIELSSSLLLLLYLFLLYKTAEISNLKVSLHVPRSETSTSHQQYSNVNIYICVHLAQEKKLLELNRAKS